MIYTKFMNKYTAVFYMHGFTRQIEMIGEPARDVGFPMSVDPTIDNKYKSISLYFKLQSFNGKIANYIFYGSRGMN